MVICLSYGESRVMAEGIDMTSLANYANQTIPEYIEWDNTPVWNPITDAGATLGRVLFYDRRLSRDGSISCSSCHKQEFAFGDDRDVSTGVGGNTRRHSMRLVNLRFGEDRKVMWDRIAFSLEDQVTMPIKSRIEMGFSGIAGDPTLDSLLEELSAIDEYRILFTAAFGDGKVTEKRLQMALAQFIRSIQSFDSPFDQTFLASINQRVPGGNVMPANGGDYPIVFNDCASCHRPPTFDIDPRSAGNGIIESFGGGIDIKVTRAPSLRDIIGPGGRSNGPMMHNASIKTLHDVIEHYTGDKPRFGNLDRRLRRPVPELTLNEERELASFLKSLTGTAIYTDEKWSDPFSSDGILHLKTASDPAFEYISGQGQNGSIHLKAQLSTQLPYRLESSRDLMHWQKEEMTISDNGLLDFKIEVQDNEPALFYRLHVDLPGGGAAVLSN